MMTVVGLGIAVVGVLLVLRSFTLVGSLVRRLPRSAYAEQTYRIGPDGVRQEGANLAVEWTWRGLRSAIRTADFWVLSGESGERPAILLRRAFSPADEERLVATMAHHGLAATPNTDR